MYNCINVQVLNYPCTELQKYLNQYCESEIFLEKSLFEC